MSEKRRDNRNRILRTGESQKKDGRYVYKYTDPFGKPKFVYSWKLVPTDRTPAGKRDCPSLREKEQAIQRDLMDGIDHAGQNMTVCQLFEKSTRCRPNVQPSTKANRKQLMRILREDGLGAMRIGSVKPSDAKEWVLRMKEKGYAYNTIRSHKRSLSAAFYMALQDDCVRRNPFDFKLSCVIENDTQAKEPLSAAQEAALLDFMRGDGVYRRYLDEVIILLGTGLRISELCGLTMADIDLDGRSVSVSHQLLRLNGAYSIAPPKTKSGVRQIPMSSEVYAAFKRVVARHAHPNSFAVYGHSDFLFLNSNGRPKVSQNYERSFHDLVAKFRKKRDVPLPKVVTAHTLRHTFCTNLANAGMNPKSLQYIMGHASIAMTLDYYAHVTCESAVAEMQRIVS